MDRPFEDIVDRVSQVIYGKKKQIRLALTCLFAGGHLLIEDRPGIGKTTLAKALSRCLGLEFTRIQYTSDLLPADVLGAAVFEQHSSSFVFHPGPIFTQVLLADEINRATPKTQSALLEAMEEKQVTTEGQTRPLPKPFFVIATLNPIEQAGTYALPESQLDRFLLRISIGYPDREAENMLLRAGDTKDNLSVFPPMISSEEVTRIRENVKQVHMSDALLEYVQDILDFTRTSPHFHTGLSPRAGLAILRTARAWALLDGRAHGLPEDIQAILPYVVGHRLHAADSFREYTFDKLLGLFREVPVP
ncbi:MAG: MoxR family ATPase [Proteobacteria bacterium]|nr:MoxR family ATPase [Pseudomonadota bacterium]